MGGAFLSSYRHCVLRNSYVLEGLAEVGIDFANGQLCVCVLESKFKLQHAGRY